MVHDLQRCLISLGLLGSLLFLMSACDFSPASPPLRLTTVTWTGYAPFYVARALNFSPPSRLDIITLRAAIDVDHAFRQRRTDLVAGALFDALRLADLIVDQKVLLVLDSSAGADGIVARPGIASVSDLRGARVAVEIGTVAQYTLLRALTRSGLTDTDVTLMNIPHDDCLTALHQQRVDAAVLWEPFLTRAREQGLATIFSSREMPGEIIDVLMGHTQVVDTRRDDLVHLLRSWQRAVQALRAQQPEAMQAAQRYLGVSADAFAMNLAGVEILDLEDNRRLFEAATTPQSVWQTYERMVQFMIQQGLLKHPPPDPKTVFDTRFLAQAQAR